MRCSLFMSKFGSLIPVEVGSLISVGRPDKLKRKFRGISSANSEEFQAQIQRNSSNYLKIVFITIKIISGAWYDTADDNKLEIRSQVLCRDEQQQHL